MNYFYRNHKYRAFFFCLALTVFLFYTIFNSSYIVDNYLKYNNDEIISDLIVMDVALDMKYILLWTGRNCSECAPFSAFSEGQDLFLRANCPKVNCYVTENRTLLDDYVNFDAVMFNGRPIIKMKKEQFPVRRSPRQTYVFTQLESSDRFPICKPGFDNFFNRTMTFRMDSDYPWPYLAVALTNGEVVGPALNMQWIKHEEIHQTEEGLKTKLAMKTKLAAWFVSNCYTRSKREIFVSNLRREVQRYNMDVDIYGHCGDFSCPRSNSSYCNKILERDYFFYLSFENSFDKDYVTEKLLTPLEHNTVPIVFGGGNYSRFLPPGSYIDGRALGFKKLAKTMLDIMSNMTKYEDMFRWKSYYKYQTAMLSAFCSMCVSLNEDESRNYGNFREWWNPSYRTRC